MELKQRHKSSLFRLIALAMAVCLLGSAFLERAASAAFSPADIRGAWPERNLPEWMNKGWLTGYPDGTMQPDRKITREEVSIVVAKAFGLKLSPEQTAVFKDAASISNVGGAPFPSPETRGGGGGGNQDTTPPAAPVVEGVQDQGIYAWPVTPNWSDASGTTSTATLIKEGSDKVSYTKNTEIAEEGSYILSVTARKNSNGMRAATTIRFTIDSAAAVPAVIEGVEEGRAYSSTIVAWTDAPGMSSTATLAKDGGEDAPFDSGTVIDEDGQYVLTVTTRKVANGLTVQQQILFTIDSASPHLMGFSDNAILFGPAEIAWAPRAGTQIQSITLNRRNTNTTILNVSSPKTIDVAGEYVIKFTVNDDGQERRYAYQFIVAEILGVEEGGVYSGGLYSRVSASWFEPKIFGEVEALLTKDGGSPRPYVKGETINELGEYVLTATWRIGTASSESKSIRFTVVSPPPAPDLSGVSDNAILFDTAEIAWTPGEGTRIHSATLDHRNTNTTILNLSSPRTIHAVGEYVLKFRVIQDGLTGEHRYPFMLVAIRGVEEGGVYATATPEWYEPKYFGEVEAALAKDGGSPRPYSKGETINEPGEYVLTVTWRTDSGNSESKSIRFMIEGEGPVAPTVELPGEPNVSYYFSVTPAWTDAEGTTSTATISKDGASPVEYNKGTLIDEDGEYVLVVTTTKTSNGLTAEATITFTIDNRPV
ncbi:S-layer homology domain-containing protein [Cohnella sp.]|uniref:S-layer homology domain-containing protein n=1 Tax=Cohnella sp. TaxID=1883426 RepID=UPI0035642AF3